MKNGASSASLTWPCPTRASLSRHLTNIPIDVYDEIFSWLRPDVDPDMDLVSQHKILARLATVCRYFAHYAIHEICRCLDFDGMGHSLRPRTATGPWCTGIIKRRQPMETLRLKVKECKIHDWLFYNTSRSDECAQMASTFLKRFPIVLSRLDNLGILTLSTTPISYFLLQTVGRLRALKQLIILRCYVNVQDDHPKEAIFGVHETPFPALRQLNIADTNLEMKAIYKDACCALGGATTLQTLVISDSRWLRFLLPHISPHLVSLNGNFSAIPLDAFLRFIKAHAALKNLTMHFQSRESGPSSSDYIIIHEIPIIPYANLDLDGDDLPDLRSFNGPFSLAPKFIRSRPVSRLAIGSHFIGTRFPALDAHVPLSSLHGLVVFPYVDTHSAWHDDHPSKNDSDDVWDKLKTIGGGIEELFVRFDVTEVSVTMFSSCFPNLLRLQLELCWDTVHLQETHPKSQEDFLANLGEDIGKFKHLKFLSLCGLWCWLSPGDQHDFVHRVFHEYCPTLQTVVFSPLMVWHLRTSPLIGECHCELELLSPSVICRELLNIWEKGHCYRERVRDWKGMMVRVLNGESLGLADDVMEIFKP